MARWPADKVARQQDGLEANWLGCQVARLLGGQVAK